MDASLETLRGMGLDQNNPLYRELVTSNDFKTAAQLAGGGQDTVNNLSALYAERDRLNTEAARAQGELVFGPGMRALESSIAEQTRTVERLEGQAQEARKELKQEIQQMRHEAKNVVPEKVGKAVGDEVNGAVTAGNRQGGNR